MKDLRILAVGMGWPTQQPGGLNTYFRAVCTELAAAYEIRGLICCRGEVEPPGGVELYRAERPDAHMFKRQWAFRREAARLMDDPDRPVDLLYAHFSPYSLGPALEARKRNIPVVMTFHGPLAQEVGVEGGGWKKRLLRLYYEQVEKSAYRLADRFVVLSRSFSRILQESYGVPAGKITIVPGATDIDRYKPHENRPEVRRQLGIDPDRPVVLTVRRLMRRMGLLELVEGWESVVRRVPDAQLLIGGKGPLRDDLQREIDSRGLSGSVRLLGYIPEEKLASYYQAADLFVVPTQYLEGFGLITAEAMACGTPVAATRVGGSAEILQPFAPRMLFADKTAEAIGEGLADLLSNRQQWPTPEQCRSYVLSRYTWSHVGHRLKRVFDEVCESENRSVEELIAK
ncbi:glycosyltransferase family 4 protein [Paenibacillus thermoaerophilus]|uniref:Glycosyltransferase family 4 protein n=1 Tax=Paenibacillus thermoaerophilus TaxID=1215385 RepID=A0ABW2V811_9BACL|nr:glycosyltransferase family 4 protein [Paenibacillus thermoaerophilus]TMV16160.1 glycosyltransferase family 4 protein [Paenibacillus thermoaerophilus]